jgi:acetyltransferase-like isoleucine patch superfamily enzyme
LAGAPADGDIMTLGRAISERLPKKWRAAAWRWRHGGRLSIGSGSYVHPRAQVIGRDQVWIGANTCISEDCWLNVNDRQPGTIGIRIGSNCFIGRQNFFSSGSSIRIADYCLTTLGCRFICASHVVDDPRVPCLSSGTTHTDSISVGANCFFGAGATVLGNVSIGHGSVIGANALVVEDLAPFSMVVGSPARVVKRYSYARQAWLAPGELGSSDLDANPSDEVYLEALHASHPRVAIPWLAAGTDFGSL